MYVWTGWPVGLDCEFVRVDRPCIVSSTLWPSTGEEIKSSDTCFGIRT